MSFPSLIIDASETLRERRFGLGLGLRLDFWVDETDIIAREVGVIVVPVGRSEEFSAAEGSRDIKSSSKPPVVIVSFEYDA